MSFIELHAQSAFSFLEGTMQPEALVAEAARLGMSAIALVDRDGVYGAPRFYQAAVRAGIKPLVGSEITLADGSRLPLLVEDREGYQNLCRLVTRMKLGAPKGAAAIRLADLESSTDGLVCLTGGVRGPLARRLADGDQAGAAECLAELVALFGRSNVFVEVQRHLDREQERVLTALTLLKRDDLDRRLGRHPIGELIVDIERPERALYRIALMQATSPQVEELVTVVYRREPRNAP